MADEVAQQEDAEIEAMIESANQYQPTNVKTEQRNHQMDTDIQMSQQDYRMDTPYGSDDEEYDSILIDAVQAIEEQHFTSFQQRDVEGQNFTYFQERVQGGGDEMDES